MGALLPPHTHTLDLNQPTWRENQSAYSNLNAAEASWGYGRCLWAAGGWRGVSPEKSPQMTQLGRSEGLVGGEGRLVFQVEDIADVKNLGDCRRVSGICAHSVVEQLG